MIHLKAVLASAAASLALVACASADDDSAASAAAPSATAMQAAPTQTNPPAATPAPATTPAPAQTGAYTDVQLRAFLAANRDLTPTLEAQRANLQGTAEQQAQAQAAIGAAAAPIFQRHGIDATTYNAIAVQARDDMALRQRLGALQAAAAPASASAQDGE